MLIFTAVACKKNSNADNNPYIPEKANDVTGGTHIYNVGTTNIDFIQNGNSDYKIVIPGDADYYENTAAAELTVFLENATGAFLPIVSDESLTAAQIADNQGKYISIGNTAILASTNIKLDKKEFGDGGFVIKTQGSRLILTGAYDFCTGTLYSAYELLTQLINFEVYGIKTITYDKKYNIKLPDLDIKDIPDFYWRVANQGMACTDLTTANRLRLNQNTNPGASRFQMTLGGATYHTMQYLIPSDSYKKAHPNWFAKNMQGTQQQHCYTARGNADELEAFIDETVERLKAETIAQPYAKFVNLGQADMPYWCNCDACTSVAAEYNGANSATLVLWINRVSTKYYEWLHEAYPDRDIRMSTFAYYDTKAPAAVKNSAGEWEAIKDLHLENGVSILYAPIEANRIDSLYFTDETKKDNNKEYYDIIKGWEAIADSVSLWIYGTNYGSNAWITPFNAFNCMQDNYRFAKENNVFWFMYQRRNSNNNTVQTNFMNLTEYLDSKLYWNVNADVNALTDKYFNASYGPGAPYMLEYFNELRAQFAVIESDDKFSRMGESNYARKGYWPEPILKRFISLTEAAQKAVEPLKTADPDKYALYSDNITIESLGLRFMLIEWYSVNYHPSELFALKQSFKNDVNRVAPMLRTSEDNTATMESLFAKWGI